MKGALRYLLLIGGILSGITISHGQITAEMIALRCAADSGRPSENYQDYGTKLAQTLGLLSPAQLARVFEKSTSVVVPDTLNELLGLDDIGFGTFSSDLSAEATSELNKIAEYLAQNPDVDIEIAGFTQIDFDGADALSQGRADNAMNYLLSLGISADRVTATGLGVDVDVSTGQNASESRKIEFRILPLP